jgi:hypothetical protein
MIVELAGQPQQLIARVEAGGQLLEELFAALLGGDLRVWASSMVSSTATPSRW